MPTNNEKKKPKSIHTRIDKQMCDVRLIFLGSPHQRRLSIIIPLVDICFCGGKPKKGNLGTRANRRAKRGSQTRNNTNANAADGRCGCRAGGIFVVFLCSGGAVARVSHSKTKRFSGEPGENAVRCPYFIRLFCRPSQNGQQFQLAAGGLGFGLSEAA